MDTFIVVVLLLQAALILICAVYTRLAAMIDRKMELKSNSDPSGRKPAMIGIDTVRDSVRKSSGMKSVVSKIYYACNPYLYGLMRYECLLAGKIPSGRIRRLLYKYVFNMHITRKTVIYGGSEFRSPWNIRMSNTVVSNNCIFDGRNGITIGKSVVFGGGVHIWTEEHSVNDPLFRVMPENKRGVVIGDHAWICSDSTLLPGVHIGEGAVVASRACVTKDCEPYGIYAGIPAKKIGERNRNLEYELDGKTTWHFY